MIQFCRNRIGHVIATMSFSKMLQTPSGSFALSFVQFGTLLLNGQSFLERWRSASSEKLSTGNPKTSASGCVLGGIVGEFIMLNSVGLFYSLCARQMRTSSRVF